MVVRFEVDACLEEGISTSTPGTAQNVDDLANQLSGLSVSSSSPEMRPAGPHIDMIFAGVDVQQDALVEMTTRANGKVRWVETYPQLSLSATPHMFIAAHTEGVITSITKKKLGTPEMEEIGQTLRPTFWKLKLALEAIQELAILHGKAGRLSLVCDDGVMQVYRKESQESCLPEEVVARFDA